MRLHYSFMHTFGKTFLPIQMQRHSTIIWRNQSELRLIFTLDFIYQRHHHRIVKFITEYWNFFFLQAPYLQRYADAVAGKGAPL